MILVQQTILDTRSRLLLWRVTPWMKLLFASESSSSMIVVAVALFPYEASTFEGSKSFHIFLSVGFFIAHDLSRLGTSLEIEDGVAGTEIFKYTWKWKMLKIHLADRDDKRLQYESLRAQRAVSFYPVSWAIVTSLDSWNARLHAVIRLTVRERGKILDVEGYLWLPDSRQTLVKV